MAELASFIQDGMMVADGINRACYIYDPELKDYRTEPYAHALASVINEFKPEIMKYRPYNHCWSCQSHPEASADCLLPPAAVQP